MELIYNINGHNQSMPLIMVKELKAGVEKDKKIAQDLVRRYPWLFVNHPGLHLILRGVI